METGERATATRVGGEGRQGKEGKAPRNKSKSKSKKRRRDTGDGHPSKSDVQRRQQSGGTNKAGEKAVVKGAGGGGGGAVHVAGKKRPREDATAAQSSTSKHHPFPTEYGDHFETPLQAYRDIEGPLALLSKLLGKKRKHLRIWDPYVRKSE